MKRTLLGVLAVVVLAVAVWMLRRGAPESLPDGQTGTAAGQYKDDSLGVGLLLPDSPGWSFRHAPDVPGGGLVMAFHDGKKASVRLHVHSRRDVAGLDEVIRQRREQLADLFQVSDLDQVIEQVIQEDAREFQGHPAWQWQAVTAPVAVPGDEPQKVMLMLLTLEREQHVFEIVGILAYPARPTPEQRQAIQDLSNDVTFVLQSFQVR